jgi:uroporphyrinogen III methyltransferase / synthase
MMSNVMENSSSSATVRQPLAGRTIIITRPREQASRFAAELERLGARAIICPTIEIVEPESLAALDDALENLFGYDWIIFTSANGVEHFMRRLQTLGHDLSELDGLRVCAIGDATAEKLRVERVHVDLVPEQFKAEGVYAALEAFLGGRESLRRLNFLIPRAAVARDYLPRALEEAGARVDVVAAYRTVRPLNPDLPRINALLAGGTIDCIAFTSSSTVRNFAELFDTSDLSQVLRDVAVACIGDVTAATASEYGLQTEIMPAEFTISALVGAIVDHFNRQD